MSSHSPRRAGRTTCPRRACVHTREPTDDTNANAARSTAGRPRVAGRAINTAKVPMGEPTQPRAAHTHTRKCLPIKMQKHTLARAHTCTHGRRERHTHTRTRARTHRDARTHTQMHTCSRARARTRTQNLRARAHRRTQKHAHTQTGTHRRMQTHTNTHRRTQAVAHAHTHALLLRDMQDTRNACVPESTP